MRLVEAAGQTPVIGGMSLTGKICERSGETGRTVRLSNVHLVCVQAAIIAADMSGVEKDALYANGRGPAVIARARQIAMYLAHTAHGISISDVAMHFTRDRSTVHHACALIEDLRDDTGFDTRLSVLERILLQEEQR